MKNTNDQIMASTGLCRPNIFYRAIKKKKNCLHQLKATAHNVEGQVGFMLVLHSSLCRG